jgi:hypothetical protein
MKNFLEGLKEIDNYDYTENGAKVYKATNSYVLDFFSQAGAMRNTSKNEIIKLFSKAYNEDKLLALKCLFYMRNIRGGQGERRLFRIILNYLANKDSEVIIKNIGIISKFGRWDDIYCLFKTKCEKVAEELIKNQLKEDMSSDTPSLLGKWLKSINTSSKESVYLGNRTRKLLGMSPKQYRKTLATLRSKIDVLEKKLTAKNYEDIDYSKVPSQAGLKYRQAFFRNDEERYTAYLDSLKDGKVKINANTLYPYQLVHKALNNDSEYEETLFDQMWKALPDYIEEDRCNTIAVVDTSGSMNWCGGDIEPIDVALSLGLYFAEKNTSIYKNHFITFSGIPRLQKIIGNTLTDKLDNMSKADWGSNTNIEAVFNLILKVAVKNKLRQDEIPNRIFIISDMQFDDATNKNIDDEYLFDNVKKTYEDYGYKLPKLVFWNVNSYGCKFPMIENDNGLALVSGCSPSIFKAVLKDEFKTPYELMLEVLNDDAYDCVRI